MIISFSIHSLLIFYGNWSIHGFMAPFHDVLRILILCDLIFQAKTIPCYCYKCSSKSPSLIYKCL